MYSGLNLQAPRGPRERSSNHPPSSPPAFGARQMAPPVPALPGVFLGQGRKPASDSDRTRASPLSPMSPATFDLFAAFAPGRRRELCARIGGSTSPQDHRPVSSASLTREDRVSDKEGSHSALPAPPGRLSCSFAQNTKRITDTHAPSRKKPGLLALSLSKGFNRRPAARYGAAERSELGLHFTGHSIC